MAKPPFETVGKRVEAGVRVSTEALGEEQVRDSAERVQRGEGVPVMHKQ